MRVVLKWVLCVEPDSEIKTSCSHYKIFIEIDRNLLEMTQYNWQLLCAKPCD